jgi:hypothetical protein
MTDEPAGPVEGGRPRISEKWRQAGVSPWRGVGLTALLHGLAGVFWLIYGSMASGEQSLSGVIFMGFLGVSQFLYILPAMIVAAIMGRSALLKGLILGASITFILNALCVGVVYVGSAFR